MPHPDWAQGMRRVFQAQQYYLGSEEVHLYTASNFLRVFVCVCVAIEGSVGLPPTPSFLGLLRGSILWGGADKEGPHL